jgi:hypothetical protein
MTDNQKSLDPNSVARIIKDFRHGTIKADGSVEHSVAKPSRFSKTEKSIYVVSDLTTGTIMFEADEAAEANIFLAECQHVETMSAEAIARMLKAMSRPGYQFDLEDRARRDAAKLITTSDQKALEFFGLAGLEFWTTGGGCTAFGRNIDDSENSAYVLVTVHEDGRHPNDDETNLTVGFYDEADHYDGVYKNVSSWDDAITAINKLVDTHV